MNKTLFKSIREYKKQSMLAPILVILEVLMEVLIPLEMAKIIDVTIFFIRYRIFHSKTLTIFPHPVWSHE